MTIKEYREVLYKDIELLEKKVEDFKKQLELANIDSFRTEEALQKLDSAKGRLGRQEFGPEYLSWEFCPEDLTGEFPF